MGIKYRSSQKSTDGVGDRIEYFADAAGHDGKVDRAADLRRRGPTADCWRDRRRPLLATGERTPCRSAPRSAFLTCTPFLALRRSEQEPRVLLFPDLELAITMAVGRARSVRRFRLVFPEQTEEGPNRHVLQRSMFCTPSLND